MWQAAQCLSWTTARFWDLGRSLNPTNTPERAGRGGSLRDTSHLGGGGASGESQPPLEGLCSETNLFHQRSGKGRQLILATNRPSFPLAPRGHHTLFTQVLWGSLGAMRGAA